MGSHMRTKKSMTQLTQRWVGFYCVANISNETAKIIEK